MKPAVRVRPAQPADLAECAALGEQQRTRRFRAARPYGLADKLSALLDAPDRIVLCAVDERGGDVVGVLVASEDETDDIAPQSVLTISHLVVGASYRRRGAGRALLAAAVRQAEDRGLAHIVAAVAGDDRDANRYLARLGFAPVAVRRSSPTSALRRTLGLAEIDDRTVLRNRLVARQPRSPRMIRRGA